MADFVLGYRGYVNWWTCPVVRTGDTKCLRLRRFPLATPEHLGSIYKIEKKRSLSKLEAPWRGGRGGTRAQAVTRRQSSLGSSDLSAADREKDESMAFRRSVYEHDDWTKHRSSSRHGRHILSIASSRVIRSLGPPVLSLTCIATVVAAFNEAVLADYFPPWVPLLHAPSLPFQLTAPALALLLVFRINASYDRFDEARKAWGSNVNRSRDISRQALTWIRHPADSGNLNRLLRYCVALPFSLKHHLTREGALKEELTGLLDQNELDLLWEHPHQPNYILQTMSEIIYSCSLSDMERASLDRNITQFHDNLGTCERILKTPLPLSYTRLTSRFLVIWHTALPFALWDECSWVVIPATFISAGALFCIEEVGVLIEEPLSMISLGSICTTIQNNVKDLVQAHADNLILNKKLNRKDETLRISKVNGVLKSAEELDS